MESWSNGREYLLEILAKACNDIGTNIQAEIDDENFVRITAKEYQALQEASSKASRVDQLEEEKKRYEEAADRIDALEAENRRLTAELQQQLQNRPDTIATPRLYVQYGDIRTPVGTASSDTRIDINKEDSKPVAKAIYSKVVTKYNTLCDKYKEIKSARQSFEDKLREEQDKVKAWNVWKGKSDLATTKKTEHIKKLKAEIVNLKSQLRTGTGDSDVNKSGDRSSVPTPELQQSIEDFEDVEVPASPIFTSAEYEAKTALQYDEEDFVGYHDLCEGEADFAELPVPLRRVNPVEDTQFDGLEVVHHFSSTDEDPDLLQPQIDSEPPELPPHISASPNIPVVVSSRSLKKKKPHRLALSAETPTSKVKIELSSSSPIGATRVARLESFIMNESLDLDDIGEKVKTPRKHRQHRSLSRQLSPNHLESHQVGARDHANPSRDRDQNFSVAVQRQPVKNTPIRPINSILQPRSVNKRMSPMTAEKPLSKKRRINSDEEINTLMEDGELITPIRRNNLDSNPSPLLQLLTTPAPPKQALDAVRHDGTTASPAGRARPLPTSRLAHEVSRTSPTRPESRLRLTANPGVSVARYTSRPSSRGSLTGMSVSSAASRSTPRTSLEPQRSSSKGSREGSAGLLQSPKNSASRVKYAQPGMNGVGPSPSPLMPDVLLPPRRDLDATFSPKLQPQAVRTPVTALKSKQTTGSSSKLLRPRFNDVEEGHVDPDEEPLRIRPLETLLLSDFRVNAKANNGHSFASREVVRGDARKHLQGCMKECCRGKFRALVEITTTNAPTPSQEERDDAILEEYMGDNAYKLQNMSKNDRHDLLLAAKTRSIANAHGRHRHAYTRASSPPGFWRADFPTTQEELKDQAEAKARERELIAERYNEAMRPGGRWKFRDE